MRYESRRPPPAKAPSGQGSGKKWVTTKLVTEVRAIRSKPHQQLAVLVGTDVDELEIADREKELSSALIEDGTGDRQGGERIAYWLPRWSIETWLKKLTGEEVDEETRYKHQVKKPNFKALAVKFVNSYRDGNDLELVSIAHAHLETPRIESK